jgi:transposase InsO family protein
VTPFTSSPFVMVGVVPRAAADLAVSINARVRRRLRELASVRVRFGYRRLTVLLKREGWRVNAKRIYRLYGLEGLEVRTKP